MSFLSGPRGGINLADGRITSIKKARRKPRLRVRGRSRGSSPTPAAGELLPPSSPLIWWDFGDTATLYQDDEETTPATAATDPVASAENKGSLATAVLNTAVDADRPTLVSFNGRLWAQFDGSDDVLSSIIETEMSNQPFTGLIVYEVESETASGLITASGANEYSVRTSAASDELQTIASSAEMNYTTEVAGFTAEVPAAAYVAASATEIKHAASHDAEEADIDVSLETTKNADWTFSVGGIGVESFPFQGKLAEVIYYNGFLSAAERLELQEYVTDKHGIVWT